MIDFGVTMAVFVGFLLLMAARHYLTRKMGTRQIGHSAKFLAPEEQALIVKTANMSVTLDQVIAVQDALSAAFEKSRVGEVDGHDIAVSGSDASFYMYGPDAEAMFAVALPILKANEITASGQATLRFGDVRNQSVPEEHRSILAHREPH